MAEGYVAPDTTGATAPLIWPQAKKALLAFLKMETSVDCRSALAQALAMLLDVLDRSDDLCTEIVLLSPRLSPIITLASINREISSGEAEHRCLGILVQDTNDDVKGN